MTEWTARNWARNVAFNAARVHRPRTVEELQAIVAGAEQLRVLGTGHSFNRIADTSGDLVLMGDLPMDVTIDSETRTARVPGGIRLAELAARLHAAGYALPNLPSLPHISLAGACATGTHGSGDLNQGLAGYVRAVQFVDARGELVEIERGEAGFDGAVVNLGALGPVTAMTVDLLPAFEIAQFVYPGVPLHELVVERLPTVFASGYSVSAFTDWRSGEAAIWLKLADPAERLDGPYAAYAATEPQHPVPGMPAEYCTEQLGVPGPWHERLPHFRPEFTPSNGEELQSEFFVARENAAEAVTAVAALGPVVAPVLQISEIRTIAADGQWLSPSYGRESLALHFTWIADRAAVEPALAQVEGALLPLGARPHWGKLYQSGPAAALAAYPKAAEFRELLGRMDPDGKFRNPFVQGLFADGS